MVEFDEAKHPLGVVENPTGIGGSVGTDMFIESVRELDFVENGSKYPITDLDQLARYVREYGITPVADMVFPGNSTANFTVAQKRLLAPGDGDIMLFTTLASSDPSSIEIRRLLTAEPNPVTIFETPFNPTPDDPYPTNPFAYIQQTEDDRKILSFKSGNTPAIEYRLEHGAKAPDVLVMGAPGGRWEQSVNNGINLALLHDMPVVVFSSESQLHQLGDPAKKLAFLGDPEEDIEGAMTVAAAFVGNYEEGRLVVEASGRRPKSKPEDLAKQIKEVGGERMRIVSLTQAEEGATVLDQHNSIHTLQVTDLFSRISRGRAERKRKAYRLGAGDAYGATLVYGIRALGTDKMAWNILKAGEAAARVMRHPDAQTGLMTHEQFYQKPMRGFKYRMHAPRSDQFPVPPRRVQNGGPAAK